MCNDKPLSWTVKTNAALPDVFPATGLDGKVYAGGEKLAE